MVKAEKALCASCPLKEEKKVSPRGAEQANIVFIGEAPGAQERRDGKVFVGKSGQLLQRMLDAYGLKAYWLTNAALCYAPNPDQKEPAAFCCRQRLIEEVKAKKPKIVVPMGNIPTTMILGEGKGITERRGKMEYSEVLETQVLPTFHPASLLRNANNYPDFAADLKKAAAVARGLSSSPVEAEHKPQARVTFNFKEVFEAAEKSNYTVLDLETSGFNYIEDRILCAVFGTQHGIFVVPSKAVYNPEFAEAIKACKTKWVGHGSKFDRTFLLTQIGVKIDFAFDTLLAHYAMDERKWHDLKQICARLFDAPDWEGDITQYLDKPRTDSYAKLPKAVLYKYAAYDGYYTRMLTDYMVKVLKKHPAQAMLVRETLVPASNALSDVEARGAKVDLEAVKAAANEWAMQVYRLGKKLDEIVGYHINPNSNPQVKKYMWGVLKLPKVRGKGDSTDKTVLKMLSGRHPFVDTLAEIRRIAKLHGTYVKGLQKRVYIDGRVRTSFLLHGTVTGRLSSQNPNLQNIPSDPDDKNSMVIRNFYIASSGMKLVYLDYRQAELRMIALYSKDPFLVRVFQEGRDLHSETAAEIFGPNFTDRQRFFAKTVNFGLPYGRSAQSIARDVNLPGLTQDQVLRFIHKYFGRMPDAVGWIERTKKFVRSEGYVEAPTGRRRRFPMRTDFDLPKIEREAVNSLCQAGASDLTLRSLIAINKEIPDAHILLTVHDSILLECPEDKVDVVAPAAAEVMRRTGVDLYGDLIPFAVDAEVGDRWGSLKKYPLE